ncbi:Hpt domain-containing protein [Dechloromonas sp. XY25]|uniref:Hpt domain-containing protein n=1 Tax=Dechloromonas hankyongensis TaxID=2908002 RepID=A0ABS9K3E1_9RHOO|nr:Hpt domain-containing protein [Dechloromonas hankyongensis]MCG2577694.1 Hpt domain-containing protein [Dechloromonas hankyongensis]
MSDLGFTQQDSGFCNLDYLMVNLGRNEATTMRLVGLFLENYPALSERLNLALEAGDSVALLDALHNIRSSCVLFSGHRCVDLAKAFEESVRDHMDKAPSSDVLSDWKLMAESLIACMHCMASEMKVFLAGRHG